KASSCLRQTCFKAFRLLAPVTLGVFNTVCLVDRGGGLDECGSGPGPELPGFEPQPGRLQNSCARASGPITRTQTTAVLHPWLWLNPGASENRPPPRSTRQTCIACDACVVGHDQPLHHAPMVP